MPMETPVVDFVRAYARRDGARLHMPGHKGRSILGAEAWDITEISGADDLSCPEGILLESERNAARLFHSRHTFYLTGGSSQGIKTMVHLAAQRRPGNGILAGRNAHKAFLHSCALLDLEPIWMQPAGSSLCACPISPRLLEQSIRQAQRPLCAVYLTSPDYLGEMLDIGALAEVAHRYGLPLLVDNAHGAYLTLFPGRHPMEQGADLCCDSAHKTLPVLTGGAYVHLGRGDWEPETVRTAAGIYGSSSPSYLILQSLDFCNRLLEETLPAGAAETASAVAALGKSLPFPNRSSEPWKLTLDCAAIGADGESVAALLRQRGAEPEYADADHVVLMFSPCNGSRDYQLVKDALGNYPAVQGRGAHPLPEPGERVISLRQGMLLPQQWIPVEESVGRICGACAVSCPPAIPLAIPGERITAAAAAYMKELGISRVSAAVL